jgi:hypothetical protein
MSGAEWISQLAQRVVAEIPGIEQFRVAPDTLSLAFGDRGVTAHDDGDVVWLAPSFTAGGTLWSRLQSKVQHLDIQTFGVSASTLCAAVDAVLAHLKP